MQQKLLAEFIGTTVLATAVLLSVTVSDTVLMTPIIAALVLGLFVYSIGPISGCYLNPAVSIGLWSIGKLPLSEAVQYVIIQCVAGFAAFGLVLFTVSDVTINFVSESSTVFLAELVGALVFTFGIASVVYGKAHDLASGLLIGGSLLLGITLAVALGSAGILNPAVALALGSLSASYVLGSIFGAIAGMYLYRHLVR